MSFELRSAGQALTTAPGLAVSKAQEASSGSVASAAAKLGNLAYQCSMDHYICSNKPGFCSHCGMNLVAGIPEPQEFPMDLRVTPRLLKPDAGAQSIPLNADAKFRGTHLEKYHPGCARSVVH